MGLSTPGQAEITSLDSGNIDDVLSKNYTSLKGFLKELFDTLVNTLICFHADS